MSIFQFIASLFGADYCRIHGTRHIERIYWDDGKPYYWRHYSGASGKILTCSKRVLEWEKSLKK